MGWLPLEMKLVGAGIRQACLQVATVASISSSQDEPGWGLGRAKAKQGLSSGKFGENARQIIKRAFGAPGARQKPDNRT